jgi:hypothetical protein
MDTKDTVVYLNLKFCYMTALALQSFLEEKDPILVSRIINSKAFKESREKRNVSKFEKDEYHFQSSISSTQNLGCGVSRVLENFFEYGVYRC